MAYYQHYTCKQCGSARYEVLHEDRICQQCRKKNEEEDKANHFLELSKLPLDQRIRRIEEWVYAHDAKPHPSRYVW